MIILLEDLRPRCFQRDVVIRIEVIQADNLVSTLEKLSRCKKADEPRRTRYKNLHQLQPVVNGIRR